MKPMLVVLLGMICAGSLVAQGDAKPSGPLAVGTPAPDFELMDLDGNSVKLSDFKGKIVVLDFWATWCGPCKKALPHMNEMSQTLKDQGVVVLGINASENRDKAITTEAAAKEKVAKFMAENKYTMRTLMNWDGKVKEAYQVGGIPASYIIGKDGKIAKSFVGFLSDEQLAEFSKEKAAGLDRCATPHRFHQALQALGVRTK